MGRQPKSPIFEYSEVIKMEVVEHNVFGEWIN